MADLPMNKWVTLRKWEMGKWKGVDTEWDINLIFWMVSVSRCWQILGCGHRSRWQQLHGGKHHCHWGIPQAWDAKSKKPPWMIRNGWVGVSYSVKSDCFCDPWTRACDCGISQARILEYSSLDLLDSGVEPGSSTLQVDSLPSEPPGKPC